MPLVEYGSSEGESGEESGDENSGDVGVMVLKPKEASNNVPRPSASNGDISKEEPSPVIKQTEKATDFKSLPVSSLQGSLVQNTDIFWDLLSKKSNNSQPIKIFAPEIPEIDPEDKVKRSLKRSAKGSSLIALLPSPKTSSSLTPSQVAKPTRKVPPPAPKAPRKVEAKPKHPLASPLRDPASASSSKPLVVEEEDDEDIEEADFLGLSGKNTHVDPSTCPKIDDDDLLMKGPGEPPPPAAAKTGQPMSGTEVADIPTPSQGSEDLQQESNVELDENALMQLCGSRGKRKRDEAGIELIDVSASSLMADAMEWHTKELTVQRKLQSHRKNQGPTSQQRRKHQITYLAHQAKEMELELTNQWATNRMTRKQTQAKYGF